MSFLSSLNVQHQRYLEVNGCPPARPRRDRLRALFRVRAVRILHSDRTCEHPAANVKEALMLAEYRGEAIERPVLPWSVIPLPGESTEWSGFW